MRRADQRVAQVRRQRGEQRRLPRDHAIRFADDGGLPWSLLMELSHGSGAGAQGLTLVRATAPVTGYPVADPERRPAPMPAVRLTAALLLLAAARAVAAEPAAFAPMRRLADGAAAPADGAAAPWLALAAVAMIATLCAAHWSIFRRK